MENLKEGEQQIQKDIEKITINSEIQKNNQIESNQENEGKNQLIKLNIQLQNIQKSIKENEKNIPKGEVAFQNYRDPVSNYELPQILKKLHVIDYDIKEYDFYNTAKQILNIENLQENDSNTDIEIKLENYIPKQNVFNYGYSKWMRQKVGKAQNIEQTYTKFIKEVIGPHILQIFSEQIKSKDKENNESNSNNQNINEQKQIKTFDFMYQFPPTMRVHPSTNPPRPLGRVHRDAEFGHQQGEVNFWLPVVDADQGGTLWSESEPFKGDFQPFQLKYGQVQRFWGCQCRHVSGVNDTGKTRISFDFRVAPKDTFDVDWKLPTMNYNHEWRICEIDIQQ